LSLSQSAARTVRRRRSLERTGLHVEDAIAASRHHLAGGFGGKFDEMLRRLIAVAASRFDPGALVAPLARMDLRLLKAKFLRLQVVPSVSFAAQGVFDGRRR
jgi:2-methylisocitrate lyase-like PEP mutase family enzyme